MCTLRTFDDDTSSRGFMTQKIKLKSEESRFGFWESASVQICRRPSEGFNVLAASHIMPTPIRTASLLAAWAALCLALPAHVAAASTSSAPCWTRSSAGAAAPSWPSAAIADGGDGEEGSGEASAHVKQPSTEIGLGNRGSQVRRELAGVLEGRRVYRWVRTLGAYASVARALKPEAFPLPLRKAGDPSVDQIGFAWIPIGTSRKQPGPSHEAPP
jgi:hypothetical protein